MTAVLAPALPRRRPAFSLGRWVERESVFAWLMVALPIAFLVALVGYPFFYGIWISLQDRPVAKPGVFVGLENFVRAWHDPVFRQVAVNTVFYTVAATLLKMVGGLGLALVMNQDFRFKNLTRALLLLPFILTFRAVIAHVALCSYAVACCCGHRGKLLADAPGGCCSCCRQRLSGGALRQGQDGTKPYKALPACATA